MEKPNVKYCFLLSKEQLDLLSRPGCYNRLNVYRAICEKTTIEPYEIVKRGIHLTINRGECLYPNTQIEKDLDINRKTVQEIIHELNMVGAIRSTCGNRGTVHINQALEYWLVDDEGEPIRNPFFSRNPSCQATKGIKPKKPKAMDSKKDDSEGKSQNSAEVTDTVEEQAKVEEKVTDSPASTAENEFSSSLNSSSSPSEPECPDTPSNDGSDSNNADQCPPSTNTSENTDITQEESEKTKEVNDSSMPEQSSEESFDSEQWESPEERFGQLYEAYKPYLTDEYKIDYSNDVWKKTDGSLVATHDEIASKYFAQMKAKRSNSASSSSKGAKAVQMELFT